MFPVFKKYFEQNFKSFSENHSYEVFDIEIFRMFLKFLKILGLNVTIPLQRTNYSYLDELSRRSPRIIINCISIKNGKTKGFNTDAFG